QPLAAQPACPRHRVLVSRRPGANGQLTERLTDRVHRDHGVRVLVWIDSQYDHRRPSSTTSGVGPPADTPQLGANPSSYQVTLASLGSVTATQHELVSHGATVSQGVSRHRPSAYPPAQRFPCTGDETLSLR